MECPQATGGGAHKRDVGGLVSVTVGYELRPEAERIPVHADESDITEDEVPCFEIGRGEFSSQTDALVLHVSCKCCGEGVVLFEAPVVPTARVPVDVHEGLDE